MTPRVYGGFTSKQRVRIAARLAAFLSSLHTTPRRLSTRSPGVIDTAIDQVRKQ